MKFKIYIFVVLSLVIQSFEGKAQETPKNEVGVSGFANFASFSQKSGKWAAGGLRVEASRYLNSKLFATAHYGVGHLEGKDSFVFDRLEENNGGFPNFHQWGLGLQLHLLEGDHFFLYGGLSYLNNRYYGVTYFAEGTPIINGQPGETTQTISTGHLTHGNFGMKLGVRSRLASRFNLKTEINYFPPFIRGQRMLDVSSGIIYSF